MTLTQKRLATVKLVERDWIRLGPETAASGYRTYVWECRLCGATSHTSEDIRPLCRCMWCVVWPTLRR